MLSNINYLPKKYFCKMVKKVSLNSLKSFSVEPAYAFKSRGNHIQSKLLSLTVALGSALRDSL